MRNAFQDVITQIKGIWGRLDGGQRLVVSAVLAATVAGLSAIVWFAGQPSYETVYTARSNEEIERVEQALQQAGVAWQVGPGRSFLVERGKIDLANMAIAKEGLGGGGSTPSIGGGLSLVEDAETKAWKLDAASRASAEAAIQQLEGVAQATVTASRPRKMAAFRDRDAENRPSATVVLKLRPGAAFDAVARAASSIAGSQLMVPQANITIVSSTGSQRWTYDPDRDTGGGTSEFLTLQRTMGEDRTRMAQDRLDQLWPGKTSVSVSVELDPSWEIRSEKVLPTEAIVQSETLKKDATESAAGKADADGNKNTSKNEVKERKYVTDIGERRTGKLMPEIKRLTVAVLYDRALQDAQGFNKTDLENAVKAIVGWDPARDKPDAFSTLVGDFAPVEQAVEPVAGPGVAETALRWAPTVGQILGVLVVVMFLRGLLRRPGKAQPAAAAAAPAKADAAEESLSPEDQQKRMRREIERSIAEDPAALAKLFESWLVEQKN
jgi:flagellar biosynthesis/type III secretory pathway M-ring protein FliF/YscJ